MFKLLLVACFVLSIHSNIWDNMYSHSEAQHPIRVDESINFDFRIPQYSILANVDFNRKLGLATLTTYA